MDKLVMGLACAALGFVGCGNTGDGGSPEDPVDPVVSGDASKPLAKLTEDEKVEVCEAMSGRYEDPEAYGRGICILAHAEVSDDSQSCDAAVEECVDAGFEPPSIEECLESLNLADCDATVRDLSDCFADSRKIADKISELRSCEDAEREGASAAWFDDASPACERLLDRCPHPFDGHEVDDSDVSGSPEDSPYVIEGNVDGQAVELRPGEYTGLTLHEGFAGERWELGISFGRVEVWLWGEETAQGLLRMPWRGTGEMSWLCLEEVEVEDGAETSLWKSSKLSALPLCAEGERGPLELTFEDDGAVRGTFQGEPVAWVNTRTECYDETCRFEFGAGDAPLSGRDEWLLEIGTSYEVDVSKEFEHSTLIHPYGVAAMACGGGGVVSYDSAVGEIHIVVDALSPLSYCPGTPVDGELSGAL